MLILRSLVFNILFYVNLALWLVLAAFPALLLPRRALLAITVAWAHTALWLMRVVAGRITRSSGASTFPKAGSSSPRSTSPSGKPS